MANRNIINSNFYEIADSDVNGDITGIITGNVISNTATVNYSNVAYSNVNVANIVVANISTVSNLTIGGGQSNQFLQTDGNGTLTWADPFSGGLSIISNGSTNVSIPIASGPVVIGAGGYSNLVRINGAGQQSNMVVNATMRINSIASPLYPPSSNLQGALQVAGGASFGGSITALGYVAGSQLRIFNPTAGAGTIFAGNIEQTANIVYTLPATKGTDRQVLSTDGQGNLLWVPGTPEVLTLPLVHFDVTYTGNNQQFSNTILQYYPANTDIIMFRNGALMDPQYYTLAGSILTVNLPLSYGDNLDIIRQSAQLVGGNIITTNFTQIPAVHFDVTVDGNNQAFSNAFLSYYSSTSDMTLFLNGSYLNQQYYQLVGDTVTFVTPLTAGDSIDVAQKLANISGNAQYYVAGPNTSVQFNDGNTLQGNGFFTYDKTTANLKVAGNVISNSVVLSANAQNVSANTVTLRAKSTTQSWIGTLPDTPGNSGEILSTDGYGGLTWLPFSGSTGINNGNSNVQIRSANGNVTVSVTGNTDLYTFAPNAMVFGNANIVGSSGNTLSVKGELTSNTGITIPSTTTANQSVIITGGANGVAIRSNGAAGAKVTSFYANGVTAFSNNITVNGNANANNFNGNFVGNVTSNNITTNNLSVSNLYVPYGITTPQIGQQYEVQVSREGRIEGTPYLTVNSVNQTTSVLGTLNIGQNIDPTLGNPTVFQDADTGLNFTGVAFMPAYDANNAERFFAATDGHVYISFDGYSWSPIISPVLTQSWTYTDVATNGNAVVATTSNGNIVASGDRGQTWVDTGVTANLVAVAANPNGQWVAVGPNSIRAYPTTINTPTGAWTTVNDNNNFDYTCVATGNSTAYWMFGGLDTNSSTGGLHYSSDNGATLAGSVLGITTSAITAVAANGNDFFAVGGVGVAHSPAAICLAYIQAGSWNLTRLFSNTLSTAVRFTSMTRVGNTDNFVYTANDGNFYYSLGLATGAVFNLITTPIAGTNTWNAIQWISDSYSYSGTGYVVGGANGEIAISQAISSALNVNASANIINDLTVGGNAVITGNLTVEGTAFYANVSSLVVQDPLIELGGGANGTPLTSDDNKDRGIVMHTYGAGTSVTSTSAIPVGNNTIVLASTAGITVGMTVGVPSLPNAFPVGTTVATVNTGANVVLSAVATEIVPANTAISIGTDSLHYMGWDDSNVEFAFGSNVTVTNDVITYNQLGNVRAANFIGNFYGNINGNVQVTQISNGNSNISIPVGNANITFSANGNANVVQITGVGAVLDSVSTIVNSDNLFVNSDTVSFTDRILNLGTLANGAPVTTVDNLDRGLNLADNAGNTLFTVNTGNTTGFDTVILNDSTPFIQIRTGDQVVFAQDVANTYTVGVVTNPTGSTTQIQVSPVLQNNITTGSNVWLQYGQIRFMGWSGTDRSFILSNVAAISNTGVVTARNYGNLKVSGINATGVSNLGPLTNVKITGGAAGQVISTDGAGNLTFAAFSTSSIVNGNSNVVVNANANVVIGANGQPNVFGVTPNGIYTTGNILSPLANGNSNITITSNGNIVINGNGTPVANFVSSGDAAYGTTGLNVAGYVNALGNISAGNFVGTFANGNSNVRIASNANIGFSANGVSNIATIHGDAGNVNGSGIDVSGHVGANVFSVNANGYTANILGSATQTSNYQFRLPPNAGSNGQYLQIDGGGNTQWSSFSRLANANTSVQAYDNANVTITATNSGGTAYAWKFNQDGTMSVPSNVANFGANPITVKTTGSGANISWANATPDTTLGAINEVDYVANASGANFTLTVGNGSSATGFSRSMQFGTDSGGNGNFYVDGFATITKRLTVTQGANLSAIGNVYIGGGTAGQVLTTDGSGSLSWTTPAGSAVPVTGITQANPGVVTTSGPHNLFDGAPIIISGVVGMTQVNGQPYYAKVSGYSSSTFGLYTDSALTTTVNTTGFTAYSSGGTVSSRVATGNSIVNGNSNVTVVSNANINLSAVGNANVVVVTGGGIALGAYSNHQLGNVANLHITGGNSGQAIITDGAGNLSFGNVALNVVNHNFTGVVSGSGATLNAPGFTANSASGSNLTTVMPPGTNFYFTGDTANVYTVTSVTAIGNIGTITQTPLLQQNYGSGVTMLPPILPVTLISAGTNMNISVSGSNATLNANTSNLGLVENLTIQSNVTGTVSNASPGATMIWNGANWAFAPVLHYKAGVNLATTTALNATYNNGSSGVGATLTNAGANAALQIDSTTVVIGQRILVKDQATPANNGIYSVTTVGAPDSPGPGARWVLTRTTDYDQPSEMLGDDVFYVSSGPTYQNASFVQLNYIATVGTTALAFESAGVATLQTVTAAGNTTTQPVTFSNANAATSSVTGAVVIGNVSNTIQSVGIGNGSMYVGNALSIAGTTTHGNTATPDANYVAIYSSVVAGANANTGGLVVGSIANGVLSTAIGNGAITTGGNITVGNANGTVSTQKVSINSTLDANNLSNGALLVGNLSNTIAMTTVGAGNIRTGYNITVGTLSALNANVNAVVQINSTINPANTANGGLLVSSNTAALDRSTAIGNGVIRTGGNVYVGELTSSAATYNPVVSIYSGVTSANSLTGGLVVASNTANRSLSTSAGAGYLNTGISVTAGANTQIVAKGDVSNSSVSISAAYYSNNAANVDMLYYASNAGQHVLSATDGTGSPANTQFIVNTSSSTQVAVSAANALGTSNLVFGVAGATGYVLANVQKNSTAANIGAFVVGNTSNANVAVAMGNGNMYVGAALQVGITSSNVAVGSGALNVWSTLNATAANSGAFIVSSNNLSNAVSTSIGNGNIQTGATLTISSNTSNANITTTVGNGNIQTGGTLTVSSNTSNANLVTTVFNGNLFTGGNIQLGTGLNSNANAAVNASNLTIISNVNTAGGSGALVVTGNLSNANLSTIVGNGNIRTGGLMYLGGDNGNLFTISPKNANNGSATAAYNLLYTGANAGEIRFGGSNGTNIFTFAQMDANGLISASTVAAQIRPTATGYRLLPAPGSGVTNANGNIEAIGTGNILIPVGNLKISNDLANQTVFSDQFISVGSNSFAGVATIGIETANSQYSGIRLSKNGTERMFFGLDSSGNAGNVRINAAGGIPFNIQSSNSSRGDYGMVKSSKGYAYYNADSTTISSGVDTKITAFTVSGTDTTGLTYSSGVWTNNTGRTIQLMVSIQSAWDSNTTGARVHFLAPANPGSGGGGSNRFAMSDTSASPDFAVFTTTAVHQMANGDVFTIWVWQNSGGSRTYGGTSAGMTSGQSSRVTMVVL